MSDELFLQFKKKKNSFERFLTSDPEFRITVDGFIYLMVEIVSIDERMSRFDSEDWRFDYCSDQKADLVAKQYALYCDIMDYMEKNGRACPEKMLQQFQMYWNRRRRRYLEARREYHAS